MKKQPARHQKKKTRQKTGAESPGTSVKNVRVFVAGGARNGKNPLYVKEAYALGRSIGDKNYQLTFGLSSQGIMGAVAKGVVDAWTKNPSKTYKPIEGVTTQEYMRRYDTEEELARMSDIVVAKTLEDRKRHMLKAEFVIFMPGGVGTLDELAFDCVAMQDGLLPKKPFVLFNSSGFFHHLLEFLKSIHMKGFSDFVPFIVVDNVFEAEVAFDMIAKRYSKKKTHTNEETEKLLIQLVYDLPYVIEKKRRNPAQTTNHILEQIEMIFHGTDHQAKRILNHEIETAYLNKEIMRMYDRLEKTGRDTALVSHKLATLKERYQRKGLKFNGLY